MNINKKIAWKTKLTSDWNTPDKSQSFHAYIQHTSWNHPFCSRRHYETYNASERLREL